MTDWSRGRLSTEQIAELLADIHAMSDQDRRLKEQARGWLAARDAARREDLSFGGELESMRRTYETVIVLAELRRDVLAQAAPALTEASRLRTRVEQAVTEWDGRQAEALSSAGGARAQIERLRSARDAGWEDASRFGGLIDEVIEALGVEHALVAELAEARDLTLFESSPSSNR